MKRIIFFLSFLIILITSLYSQDLSSLDNTEEKKYLIYIKGECANRNPYDFYTWDKSFLIDVVKMNFYSAVDYTLQYDIHKKHINDEIGNYAPPLFWALQNGNKEISELLLRNGANPNFITEDEMSAFESIDTFVSNKIITDLKAHELKQLLIDFGYKNDSWNDIKISDKFFVRDNLRLRTVDTISSSIITTLKKDEDVKIIFLGKYDCIDGINDRWVFVESKNKKKGWCFAGYLRRR